MFSLFSTCSCSNTESDISATLSIHSLAITSLDNEEGERNKFVRILVDLSFSLNCTISCERDFIGVLDVGGHFKYSKGNFLELRSFQLSPFELPSTCQQAYSGDFQMPIKVIPSSYVLTYIRKQSNGKYKILGIGKTIKIEISTNCKENAIKDELSEKRVEEVLQERFSQFNIESPLRSRSSNYQIQYPKTKSHNSINITKENKGNFIWEEECEIGEEFEEPFHSNSPSKDSPITPSLITRSKHNNNKNYEFKPKSSFFF